MSVEQDGNESQGEDRALVEAAAQLDPPNPSKLRWLAPLFSIALLSLLVLRGSHCNASPSAGANHLSERREAKATNDKVFEPLQGTKSFGIQGPPSPNPDDSTSTDSNAPVKGVGLRSMLDEMNSLGGSKSGFGGLGLRGPSGAAPAASEPQK